MDGTNTVAETYGRYRRDLLSRLQDRLLIGAAFGLAFLVFHAVYHVLPFCTEMVNADWRTVVITS